MSCPNDALKLRILLQTLPNKISMLALIINRSVLNLEHRIVVVVACIEIFVLIFWRKVYVVHRNICLFLNRSVATVTRDAHLLMYYSFSCAV